MRIESALKYRTHDITSATRRHNHLSRESLELGVNSRADRDGVAILFLAIGLAVGGLVIHLHRRRRAAERAEAAQAAEQQARRAVEREDQAR